MRARDSVSDRESAATAIPASASARSARRTMVSLDLDVDDLANGDPGNAQHPHGDQDARNADRAVEERIEVPWPYSQKQDGQGERDRRDDRAAKAPLCREHSHQALEFRTLA